MDHSLVGCRPRTRVSEPPRRPTRSDLESVIPHGGPLSADRHTVKYSARNIVPTDDTSRHSSLDASIGEPRSLLHDAPVLDGWRVREPPLERADTRICVSSGSAGSSTQENAGTRLAGGCCADGCRDHARRRTTSASAGGARYVRSK